MYYDVIKIKHIAEYKIEIFFKDGGVGIVDFSEYIKQGGVFKKFKEMDFFKNVYINPDTGVLTWADEIDIAPETLYKKATGNPLPSWMVAEA